jgi:glutamate-5-semialdehyde dehydrogenase
MQEVARLSEAAVEAHNRIHTEVRAVLLRARAATAALRTASTARKNAFLQAMDGRLADHAAEIAAANAADLAEAKAAGRGAAFLDRLRLDAKGLAGLRLAVREIAALPDPVGTITSGSRRPNGLEVRRQRVPLGVIGIVYEARPNVTVDAAALCVKAGNCVVLRGGSEARRTSGVLVDHLRAALAQAGLPEDAVQQPSTFDRSAIDALVSVPAGLDVVIPRGGEALIAAVNKAARVPVIQHYKGVCHLFVHASADLDLAERVIVNAKCQRPGVCNAVEAILVDSAIASVAVPRLAVALRDRGVEVRACPRSSALAPDATTPAEDGDYGCEFLDLVCLMRVVDGLDGALEHIARYGSNHTEGILTRDLAAANRFVDAVDCSCAVVNASTRFNDGGQLGLGAEIGISTTKLHAYGPMGLESLTTERFVVVGDGQVRT